MKVRLQKLGFDTIEKVGEEISIMDDNNVILVKFYETTDGYLMSYSDRVKVMDKGEYKDVQISKVNMVSN